MKDIILNILNQSIEVKKEFITANIDNIITAAQKFSESIKNGGKILLFGNGGSAADAQHIAAEFVNRFQIERAPLPALALTTDTSVITSIANDYNFDLIFEKQVQALCKKEDIAIGISTSGNSVNVIKGIESAKKFGAFTLGIAGCMGGKLYGICDLCLTVKSDITARIQEAHITLGHILCELSEKMIVSDKINR